jgi:hypothetical protein
MDTSWIKTDCMTTKITLLLSLLVLMACSKAQVSSDDKQGLSIEDFERNLKHDMDHHSITAAFGMPLKDIGSGIHIYVYELVDSSEVWIGFTDQVIYAKHMGVNHVLLEDLVLQQ